MKIFLMFLFSGYAWYILLLQDIFPWDQGGGPKGKANGERKENRERGREGRGNKSQLILLACD